MIKIIYGSKGTGKTKRIIDMANDYAQSSKGDVLFLADTERYVREIKRPIRFVFTKEYGIVSKELLIGFVKGLLAGNYDIKEVFIDGAARMMSVQITEMKEFLDTIAVLSEDSEKDFILTVSCDKEALPEFFKAYID